MTMEATEMTLYICEECGHKKEYKTQERNPMYRDCPECKTRVGMRASNPYDAVAFKRFGTDKVPSKWETIKNRPKGGNF